MYSEYVSERAVATVLCRSSVRYVFGVSERAVATATRMYEYTVSERAVATVADCVVTSVRYVFGVYS